MAQTSQKVAKKGKNEIGLNEVKSASYSSWIHMVFGYKLLFPKNDDKISKKSMKVGLFCKNRKVHWILHSEISHSAN